MTGPPAVLGIDLGTSQVKALLCAAGGAVLGQGVAGYQVSTPQDGWAETDPEHWWRAAAAAVRSAAGPATAEVAGLAVVGQMHGLVLYSERMGVLRPAVLWLDRRADAEAGEYQRLPDALRAPLGNDPSPGMAGPMLLWLARLGRPVPVPPAGRPAARGPGGRGLPAPEPARRPARGY